MKINLQHVAGDLGLEFPDLGDLSLLFKDIVEGAGTIAITPQKTHLDNIKIKDAALATHSIRLPNGILELKTPLSLHGVLLDLFIGKTIQGNAEFKSATTQKLVFRHEKHACTVDVDCRDFSFKQEQKNIECTLRTLTIKSLVYNANDIACTLKNVRIENIVFELNGDVPSFKCGFMSAESLHVKMPSKQFRLNNITLGKGVKYNPEHVFCAAMTVDNYECDLEALPTKSSNTDSANSNLKVHFDKQFLDALSGNLKADLKVKATVPVIGKRRATHRFRVPIEHGVINYKTLEEGLSDLENAFVDFNLKGNMLVLARDIPLIPGFDKPIVSWALKEDEIELAKNNQVRLPCLLHPILAEAKQSSDQKSKLKLHTLDLESLDATLQCDKSVLLLCPRGKLDCEFDVMSIKGRLFYDHDNNNQVTQTSMDASLTGCKLHFNAFQPLPDLEITGELFLQKEQHLKTVLQGVFPKSALIQGAALNASNLSIKLPTQSL